MARRKRRKFTAEQKADAVRMVREVGNLSLVARDLELTETPLRNWVKQADIDKGNGPGITFISGSNIPLKNTATNNVLAFNFAAGNANGPIVNVAGVGDICGRGRAAASGGASLGRPRWRRMRRATSVSVR